MYPRVKVNTKKFRHNVKTILEICHKKNISVMGVSKVFCADKILVDIMNEEGVDYIADSRIENLKNVDSPLPKVLLRLPMISEANLVVKESDISLNSELATIFAINEAAKQINKIHDIILMVDLGDLREGIFDINELKKSISEIVKLENVMIKGLGTNLTCYGGVIPTKDILNELIRIARSMERKFGLKFDIISGGNSSNIPLIIDDKLPRGINNVRLGEVLVLGRETAFGKYLDNMYSDVFTLEVEVIELKRKPSVPIGEIGMNAFGKVPTFEDKGMILRAILAIGQQDVDFTELIATNNITLLGSSSDHIIVDVTNSQKKYQVGDIIEFKLTYASILSLYTSKYVGKVYE